MRRLLDSAPVRQPAAGTDNGVADRTKARILRQRPYHPWHLIPLAAMLCEEGYSDHSRGAIMDEVESGHCLDFIVSIGLLEPADLRSAGDALDAGRQPPWSPEPEPDAPLVPPELDQDAEDEDAEGDAERLDRRIRELVEGWEPPVTNSAAWERAVRDHDEAFNAWVAFFFQE